MEIKKKMSIEIKKKDILELLHDSTQVEFNMDNMKIKGISVSLIGQHDYEFDSMTVEIEGK